MRVVLFGYPLGHSVSPAMHRAALASAGLHGWSYAAEPVRAEGVGAAVTRLRGPDYAGANVTVPHKSAVIAHLDGLTPVADAIGAVNTIVKQGSSLIGHNTDAAGFLADLYAHEVSIARRAVLVLGAGGAARAVVAACAGVGARLRVVARRQDQAEALGALAPVEVYDWAPFGLLRASEGCALIVNTTSLGMAPHVEGTPWQTGVPFPPGAFVYDLVYNPADTALTSAARSAGLLSATGLGMLVEQGALAFEQWTGRAADRAAMRQAAEAELARLAGRQRSSVAQFAKR
ncbi:MAG: shikimate dehydrogenase [Anaerolineales bacterium]|nr:shikimate dehydrogenase [Anaerolineales bacterium]